MSDRFTLCATPEAAVDALEARYGDAIGRLRAALERFRTTGEPPSMADRSAGAFVYPELRVTYAPDAPVPAISRAFGKFSAPGVYSASVTRPAFFRAYLCEQIGQLAERYPIAVEVGPSTSEIPYPYVADDPSDPLLHGADPVALAHAFPAPNLAVVGDELADGERVGQIAPDALRPLSLFEAPRVDYALQRLRHYTGTPHTDFQEFILFTNYHRYVSEFVAYAVEQARNNPDYVGVSAPGGRVDLGADDPAQEIDDGAWRRHQMPAYHLIAKDGSGITLVNIGVGPSNAKTITDHLAVLRPQCFLMVGHCGGLRHSQRLGDYVLAHAYLRRDRVLDEQLPLEVPIPPIAEIQVALHEAARLVTGDDGEALKARLRTGTVVTDADRNWELRATEESRRFNKSRAIAIDMESATIAANGFRFRVPYGALLCVSDKPLHGEPKLPGPANAFYAAAVAQHLRIGIEAINILKRDDAAALHSRKLRAFDEPPFR